MPDPRELELDGSAVRRMTRDVLERLLPWLDRMATEPVSRLDGSRRVARSVRSDWPETGTPWRRLLAALDRSVRTSVQTTSPGYLAYVPGGGLPHVAVADLYADLVNRYTGLWMPAPGLVQLEVDVLRWFCRLVGYGPEAGGLLTSGGSLANLAAIVAARRRSEIDDLRTGVIAVTDQTHHSVRKSAMVAGFDERSIVLVPTDAAYRMRPDALDRLLREARGRRLVAVVASGGTTAVGAVDPIDAIADVCAEHGVWLHVDAAYGGFFALTERGRAALAGLERADSIALDPHKGLFLPYGTGCVLVRRREDLRRAHAVSSSYLPPPSTDEDAWDFADLGPELSRPARGVRVWLPLRMHGFATFRAALDEKLDLARVAADGVRALPDVRMVTEPELSLFAFRAEPPGLSPAETDALNRRWLARTNQRQRVFLTGATVPLDGGEAFVLRVCVLCFRTHADRIAMLVEDLAAGLAEADQVATSASSSGS